MNIQFDVQSIEKIELIDQLRARFSAEDNEKLLLPQIIVIGDQSSGKSSILEAISGIELPKGVGTVTKCPIIIQMRKTEKRRNQIKYKKLKFKDIEDIPTELSKVQKEEFENRLSKEPVTLLIESPDVVTLTVIDLPGIVKTTTKDSPKEMISETESIARFYMNQSNSLILCVIPANQDIATSSIINLVSECDPTKSRIIGVITKMDKLDDKEATCLPSILRNEQVTFVRGFYGLVVSEELLTLLPENRPGKEQEIFNKLNLWENHKNRLGLKRFTDALVTNLVSLIDGTLPHVKSNIEKLLKLTQDEIGTFSKYSGNSDLQLNYIFETINKVVSITDAVLVKADCDMYKYRVLENFVFEKKYLVKTKSESGTFHYFQETVFTLLYDDFEEVFKRLFVLKNAKYANEQILEEMVEKYKTEYVQMCVSSRPFRNIINEILESFKEISLKYVDVFNEFIHHMIEHVLVADIEDKLLKMKSEIKVSCHQILDYQRNDILTKLDYLFNSEQSYFSQKRYTDATYSNNQEEAKPPATPTTPMQYIASKSDSSFSLNQAKNLSVPLSNSSPKSNSTELEKCKYPKGKELKDSLVKYSNNLKLRIGDVVPKFIILSLFQNFKDALEKQLREVLLKSPHSYFCLSDDDENRIKKLRETLESLKYSKNQLDHLR